MVSTGVTELGLDEQAEKAVPACHIVAHLLHFGAVDPGQDVGAFVSRVLDSREAGDLILGIWPLEQEFWAVECAPNEILDDATPGPVRI